jgi:quercetin dioxygenase-like cupin family protein
MQEIKITPLENAPRVPFKVDGRIMLTSEKLEIVHLTLPPGDKMEPHTQPFDVAFFVISGNGELFADEKTIPGNPGDCIQIPAWKLRSWSNNGQSEFRVLVIKQLK